MPSCSPVSPLSPYPRGNSATAFRLAALLLLLSSPALAEVRLEVNGSVAVAGEALEARIDVTNRGTVAAEGLSVQGEFLGEHDETVIAMPVGAGHTRSVALRFAVASPPPGVHILPLRLDYTPSGAGPTSQRAYLMVALGGHVGEALRLVVSETEIQDRAHVRVIVSSADGGAHTVRLRVHPPRGLNAHGDPVTLVVPAHGTAQGFLPILRAGAPRPSVQGVLVSAATVEGPTRTTVAASLVRVLPDPALMPRLRTPLAGVALALALWALAAEVRRRKAATAS